MRISGKRLRILGVAAGVSAASAALTMGACGGDTGTIDGGDEAGFDAFSGPDGQPEANSDVVTQDATPDADGGSDVNPVDEFRTNVATTLCNRLQGCCNGLDAGTFDYAQCVSDITVVGWYSSNLELTTSVLDRGNVVLNSTSVASCLADVATLSCPTISSSEFNTSVVNCYAATHGTLDVGADCVASVECKVGQFCQFAGIDAGTTDGGLKLGQCADLITQGQPCGQALPYGQPNYSSAECAYKGWQPPQEFCDYDTYPDASGYACQPLRTNSAKCYFDNECSSGVCGDYGQDCATTTCTCETTRDFSSFCGFLAIKDAGTD